MTKSRRGSKNEEDLIKRSQDINNLGREWPRTLPLKNWKYAPQVHQESSSTNLALIFRFLGVADFARHRRQSLSLSLTRTHWQELFLLICINIYIYICNLFFNTTHRSSKLNLKQSLRLSNICSNSINTTKTYSFIVLRNLFKTAVLVFYTTLFHKVYWVSFLICKYKNKIKFRFRIIFL